MGAGLIVETPNGQVQYYSPVDADGRFEFYNVTAGQGMLGVMAQTADHRQISKVAKLTIPPDDEITHHFDFGQGATVQGTATIAASVPEVYALLIAGDVDLAAVNNATHASILYLRTIGTEVLTHSGPFQFDAVDPGEYTLLISTDGLGQMSGTRVTVPEGEALVNVDVAFP
jgi:hypothetical protein